MTPDHWRALLPESRWLYAFMLGGKDVTVTIEKVQREALMRQGIKEPELRPVLYIKGKDKQLVLNKTNLSAIAKLHGDKPSQWAGKKVTLYETTTHRGRETVPCIRIKGAR